MTESQVFVPDDGKARCWWAGAAPEFLAYHDDEWGYPVDDDVRLFEKLTLESFQSGLSWRTIFNKRERFRIAFAGFDVERIAGFDDSDRERLLADAGIVRHRGKIDAAIHNAGRAIEIKEIFGSLAAYVWQFEPRTGSRPQRITQDWVSQTPTSAESIALSKDLKTRGWKFFGPTTAYAFMQSMGIVNDHTEDCCMREPAELARRAFRVPR